MSQPKGKLKPKKITHEGKLVFFFSLTLDPVRDKVIVDELLDTPLGSVAGKLREMLRNGTLGEKFALEEGGAKPATVTLNDMSVDI